ncbi:MAG: bifunctional DNA-formamidopyrimidine glycosylase/DNA-(apurinic or apyrimidinic site) lyase [Lentisphaerae bacterium]|jgi:formamidopyrimidine-DNA glycosylase|nr:bifunctional DNA-formamidopyrimidine glycosylase/DNA-(apurinic or apyrimidinic site) lyase [Lentisphaerota bacterium]MBT5605881.1 bifunctional DNA-formamidopyrimidine glycosylase/DNA-(apurinic or apyrimidinic site) lyase [Lentisphaerota bacterium]MBT7057960.1 bifunctional DNA-formamidopyrimidine glycosylase/DNA-(apurinic or apyrimidinic site) lyase [Lentisphaerota bacterium]MBT7848515.1 bifunctional DNA-formamidopyrimidine glycosylase/DNA-(apurinic or apyrimidinic site) lyase [Lentisphaerota 
MPELPEVETVCRSLRPHVVERQITAVHATVDTLRLPVDLEGLRNACTGRKLTAVRRRGKYIIVEMDAPRCLLLHLGMTGAFRVCAEDIPFDNYDRVSWSFSDGTAWRFEDIRRFGSVQVCAMPVPGAFPDCLRHLGPEPLNDTFDADYLSDVIRGRKQPIKNLLMDQRTVVGVGNIYANEALFRAGIRPGRKSGHVGRARIASLVGHTKTVLEEAIALGGTTISDFKAPDGKEGKFRLSLQVYGKEGHACPRCTGTVAIRRTVLGGRATFHCPRCQH